ncbi:hypothetical protein KJ973_02990 [Patescibacteria group bacterium]|nr:hypothetical protein [Patescibacteria group bacterium]MBU1246836.1 hypothetical protein [Patescibacteria group bacterium]MBU1519631.1 hypothetical protein [Patescibacteria group bacterium]MBU1730598.1 hypothetical protein [Patescibacteria group bacterium]MBU1956445.1 hypothetical protein [Patescibacteria group bacterium]
MNEQNNPQSNVPAQTSKNIWITISVVIITALIVGGGIYAWQKSKINKLNSQIIQTQKITSEQEGEITNLNTEITQLNNRLLGIENKKSPDVVGELTGWKTYTNNNDGYSIMYPSEFWPQCDHDLMNYDINDPRYERGNPDGIKIQVQKHILGSNFESFSEYIAYQKNVANDFNDPAKTIKLGDFVIMSQYTKNGPGGAFMVYTSFDQNTKNYFDILIFESGYSKNKELVEKIISTFEIL